MFYLYCVDPSLLTDADHKKNYSRVGALISISSKAPPLLPGTSIKELARTSKWYLWDEATQNLVYTRGDRFIAVETFFDRFTENELDLYYQKVPARVDREMNQRAVLSKPIDLDAPKTTSMMQRMVTAGIMTQARAMEVIA